MVTLQMFICIIEELSLIKTAIHKTINILEDISMSNKYFLKKSWVNVDVCIEDYHNSGTTLKDLEKMLTQLPMNAEQPYIYAPSAGDGGGESIKRYLIERYRYESQENLLKNSENF